MLRRIMLCFAKLGHLGTKLYQESESPNTRDCAGYSSMRLADAAAGNNAASDGPVERPRGTLIESARGMHTCTCWPPGKSRGGRPRATLAAAALAAATLAAVALGRSRPHPTTKRTTTSPRTPQTTPTTTNKQTNERTNNDDINSNHMNNNNLFFVISVIVVLEFMCCALPAHAGPPWALGPRATPGPPGPLTPTASVVLRSRDSKLGELFARDTSPTTQPQKNTNNTKNIDNDNYNDNDNDKWAPGAQCVSHT